MERLISTKSGLLKFINGFVEGKNGKREGLEPILPAGEITSKKFEEIMEQFIGDVLAQVDSIAKFWLRKGLQHVSADASDFLTVL